MISPVLLHALCVCEVVYNFIIFIGSCIHHHSQDIKQFQWFPDVAPLMLCLFICSHLLPQPPTQLCPQILATKMLSVSKMWSFKNAMKMG